MQGFLNLVNLLSSSLYGFLSSGRIGWLFLLFGRFLLCGFLFLFGRLLLFLGSGCFLGGLLLFLSRLLFFDSGCFGRRCFLCWLFRCRSFLLCGCGGCISLLGLHLCQLLCEGVKQRLIEECTFLCHLQLFHSENLSDNLILLVHNRAIFL